MEKQNPGRWPFAILIAVATIGVAFAAAPQSDIGQQIEQQAVGLHPIYGLAKGSSWTYEISNGKLKETYDWTVSKATKDGKYTVYELTRRLGTSKIFSFSYQGLLGNDLYDVGSAGMGGPGYTLSAVEPIMKKPLVIGATWKWNRPFRGQTMSGPDGKAPDMSSLAQDCVATIEGEEIVTVGAGKFRCYRIHVVRTSRAYGTHETTEWISLQAGLVKREYKPRPNEPGGTEELVKFTAGSSLPG